MSVSTRLTNTKLPVAELRASRSIVRAMPCPFDCVGVELSSPLPAKMSPILPTPCTGTPASRSAVEVVRARRVEREVVAPRRAR